MPVDPNHKYVDQAHEKTIAGDGFRYSGCYNQPRPSTSRQTVQDGWNPDGRARFIEIESAWQEKPCTHDKREADPACRGCCNI